MIDTLYVAYVLAVKHDLSLKFVLVLLYLIMLDHDYHQIGIS